MMIRMTTMIMMMDIMIMMMMIYDDDDDYNCVWVTYLKSLSHLLTQSCLPVDVR